VSWLPSATCWRPWHPGTFAPVGSTVLAGGVTSSEKGSSPSATTDCGGAVTRGRGRARRQGFDDHVCRVPLQPHLPPPPVPRAGRRPRGRRSNTIRRAGAGPAERFLESLRSCPSGEDQPTASVDEVDARTRSRRVSVSADDRLQLSLRALVCSGTGHRAEVA